MLLVKKMAIPRQREQTFFKNCLKKSRYPFFKILQRKMLIAYFWILQLSNIMAMAFQKMQRHLHK